MRAGKPSFTAAAVAMAPRAREVRLVAADFERDAMAGELARAGFRVSDDTSPPQWAARYGGRRRRLLLLDERLAVGVSDGPARAERAG